MKKYKVTAYAPLGAHIGQPTVIEVSEGESFTEFRRKCGLACNLDVLSVFTSAGMRVTDVSELSKVQEVYLFDSCCPDAKFSKPMTMSTFLSESRDFAEKPLVDKRLLRLRVETIGLPKEGKTSLIWQFVKNNLHYGENSSFKEITYHKEISIEGQTIDFSISDYKETYTFKDIEHRLGGKEVLLFCTAKANFAENRKWLLQLIERATSVNPRALVVVAITKSDLEARGAMSYKDLQRRGVVLVCSSIFYNRLKTGIKSSEEVFAAIAMAYIHRANDQRQLKARPQINGGQPPLTERSEVNFWLLRTLRPLITCFHW